MELQKILIGAFWYVNKFKSTLIQVLWGPLLVMVILDSIKPESVVLMLIVHLLSLLVYTYIAITTHRVILLGPSSVSVWGFSKPSSRELLFILYSIYLGLIMIPVIVFAFIPGIGPVIAFLGIAYLMGRFSLIFPAVALDKEWTLSHAWELSKDHQVVMMIVVGIFPFVLAIPQLLLIKVPEMRIVMSFVSAIALVFVVAAVSVAFDVLNKK